MQALLHVVPGDESFLDGADDHDFAGLEHDLEVGRFGHGGESGGEQGRFHEARSDLRGAGMELVRHGYHRTPGIPSRFGPPGLIWEGKGDLGNVRSGGLVQRSPGGRAPG